MASWTKICDEYAATSYVNRMATFNSGIYGATIGPFSDLGGQCVKVNPSSPPWTLVCNKLEAQAGSAQQVIVSSDNRLYCAMGPWGWLCRLNVAENAWENVCDHAPVSAVMYAIAEYNGRIYSGDTNGKLWRTNAAFTAWELVCDVLGAETDILSLCVYDGRLYAGTGPGGKLYRMNLAENAWEQVCNTKNGQAQIWSLIEWNGKLYGGTAAGGRLFKLNDAGNAWDQVCAELNGQTYIYSLFVHLDRIYAGTSAGSRLFRLNSAENAWEQVCAQYAASSRISDLAVLDGYLYGVCGGDLLLADGLIHASYSYSQTSKLAVDFTDTSDAGGGITSWSWDFGDGNTSSLQNPSHSYSVPGSYSVTLTIVGGDGTSSTTQTVSVWGISANFTATPISGALPLSVTFTDASLSLAAITSWQWDFGDGSTSTVQNPTHVYTTPGAFAVTLTVTSADGTDTITKSTTSLHTSPYELDHDESFITVRGVSFGGGASPLLSPPIPGRIPATGALDFGGYPLIGKAPVIVRFTNDSN